MKDLKEIENLLSDYTIAQVLDIFIRKRVKKILDTNKFPEYDDIYTDTLSEIIDKLCIVHIRYWYLEDAMSDCNDDELLILRKKSESLFKEKRPMLVAAFDKLIVKMLKGDIDYTPINTKHYKGWKQND